MTTYCGHCGDPSSDSPTDGAHVLCTERLGLEPPRYCTSCRRRLVVQVAPDHWTARCVQHGETTASTWV